MTNYRWLICAMLFIATTINYMDRQVLSLTWRDFIAPEFHWTNTHYGLIASLFSGFYAISMLFAGRLVDCLIHARAIYGPSEYGLSAHVYTHFAELQPIGG